MPPPLNPKFSPLHIREGVKKKISFLYCYFIPYIFSNRTTSKKNSTFSGPLSYGGGAGGQHPSAKYCANFYAFKLDKVSGTFLAPLKVPLFFLQRVNIP